MRIKQVAVSVLSVGGLFVLLNACGPTTPVTPPPPTPPVANACPGTITAGVGGLVYAPASCTVKVNTSVTIQASVAHPLDTVSTNWPTAIAVAKTDQTVKFTAVGTYTYKCSIHGLSNGMTGTITVEN
jgi:plastocyanin